MIRWLELGLMFVLAVVWPLCDYFYFWPKFLRAVAAAADPRHTRLRFYWMAIAQEWAMTLIAGWLWLRGGEPLRALWMAPPTGWRLWVGLALVVLMAVLQGYNFLKVRGSEKARNRLRTRFAKFQQLVPHADAELPSFFALSVTAGFCEEFLYRGFAIWVLAPWLTFWGAATIAVIAFGVNHAYQGKQGILSTTIVGAFMTAFLVLTHSLVTVMLLHALVDIGSGAIGWLALREAPAEAASHQSA